MSKEILTQEQISDKCKQLEEARKKKVYPIVFVEDEDTENPKQYVGYIEEPSRQAKMAAFDEMSMKSSLMLAGEKIIECALIKEESHPAFHPENMNVSLYDGVYIAGCLACTVHVKILSNTFKKK